MLRRAYFLIWLQRYFADEIDILSDNRGLNLASVFSMLTPDAVRSVLPAFREVMSAEVRPHRR
jgi:hypothetical protein